MNNQSSSSSCFELQNLYHRIYLLSQKGPMQPQLLEMLEGEGARDLNLGFADYERSQMWRDADLPEKNGHGFQPRDDTLQSLVQSCSYCNRRHENPSQSRGDDIQECKLHQPDQQSKLTSERLRSLRDYTLMNYHKNFNIENCYHSKPQLEKHHSTSVAAEKEAVKHKTRIRWTEDLHKKFIECVDRLGGSRKAKPKGILKLMKCDGLTIFHVKSHLQKYRVDELMPEEKEGNSEQLGLKTGMQIVEALRLQMDVQRHLYEQLESQKKLQMRIEEQAKQLQTMLECQLNKKN